MTVGGLDRNAITLDNHINIAYNDDNIFTSSELYPDPLYDPNENKTWWEQHWFEFIQNLAFSIALLVSVILAACGHPQMLIFCIKAAISAAVSGAIIVGAITAFKGGDIEDVRYAFRQGAIDGFKSGFTMAAIAYGVSSAVKALASMKGAPNKAKANRGCPGEECFKEGTLVETEEGLKPIEDIEVGDKVLAYDEKTGEQAYKPVVQLFRNTTQEWYHVFVNGEEIVCTGGHPFYVLNAHQSRKSVCYEGIETDKKGKWICANELKISDKLLLSNGTCAIIEEIQIKKLEKPETTYNFEVADFHTYYVAENEILVHNDCVARARRKAVREAWKQERELVAKTGQGTRNWSGKQRMELLKKGKVKGFEGHHINSVSGSLDLAGNPNNIRFVTRPEHFALHSYNWQTVTTGKLIDRMAMLNGIG